MAEVVISTDTVGAATERTLYDTATDTVRVEHVVDTAPILRAVHDKKMETGGKSKSGNFWHVGSIDMTVWSIWCRQRGIHPDAIFSPDYSDEVLKFILEHKALSPTEGKH
jgi:hypothetical protein